MKSTNNLVRIIAALLFGSLLFAQASAQGDQSLRGKLEQAIEIASQNTLQIVSLNQTALPNIFEVELNTGEILYSDISGDYLFAGDMYATTPTGLMNLSASPHHVRGSVVAVRQGRLERWTRKAMLHAVSMHCSCPCAHA